MSAETAQSVFGKARLDMLSHTPKILYRVGCASPGLHCQEFPMFESTLDEARERAKKHTEWTGHVSSVKHVQTTPIENWVIRQAHDAQPPVNHQPKESTL